MAPPSQPRRSPGPSPERHLRGPGSHPAHRCLPPPGRLGRMGLLPRQCSPSLRHRPIDPTAQRIGQALDVAPEGLTRMQIRALFHRHVSKERIDLALDQLLRLGLIHRGTSAGRGRAQPSGPGHKTPRTARPPAKPALMAHRALKAHTSTQRAHKALRAHTSTPPPCALPWHLETQKTPFSRTILAP
jgi:hypothetical protein